MPFNEPDESCVCVREGETSIVEITWCMDLLTQPVSVLAGGPGRGLMANCGHASVLAQFSWDTDAMTEVCMTGFNWESCDHTCGGRKAVGLGRMLSCSVLEARPELSPQGGLGAGGWAQWSQRRGA